ncbi:MAG TPA: hypothetical protein VE999_00930 [Gemmataceae bacterium]|nr:hypothetical protein [Gemmataceae bacterium]
MTVADQIEQSWQARRPEVPQTIWRQLRALKYTLAPTAQLIEDRLRNDTLIGDLRLLMRARGVRRQKMLTALQRCFPAAQLTPSKTQRDVVSLTWVSPKPPIIIGGVGGELQNCLLVCAAVAFPNPPLPGVKAISLYSTFVLEIADHAAARLLQRAPQASLRQAALDAADAFATAEAKCVAPLVGNGATIYLPAGGAGCFVCTVIGGHTREGRKYVYARASTFLPHSWLRPDQRPLPPAAEPEKTVALALWHWDGGPALRLPPHTKECAPAFGPVARRGIGR